MMNDWYEIEFYRCPRCGGGMERGYIASNVRLGWLTPVQRKKKSLVAAEKLTKLMHLYLAKLPAVRCKRCKIGMFRY
jgi:predicted nucleic-acid-binding Zn-ribbon protein